MHVLNTGSQSETHCHYLPAGVGSVIGGMGGGGLTLLSFDCVSPWKLKFIYLSIPFDFCWPHRKHAKHVHSICHGKAQGEDLNVYTHTILMQNICLQVWGSSKPRSGEYVQPVLCRLLQRATRGGDWWVVLAIRHEYVWLETLLYLWSSRRYNDMCQLFKWLFSDEHSAGVHCTHGYNRTGFLIIAYLVEMEDWR